MTSRFISRHDTSIINGQRFQVGEQIESVVVDPPLQVSLVPPMPVDIWMAQEPLPSGDSSCACGNPACTMGAKAISVPHGDYSRYTNHKCRCDLCSAAYKVQRQKYRVPKPEVCGCGNLQGRCTRKTSHPVEHGLSCYSRHNCRCDVCKNAMNTYQSNRRRRQRLQADAAEWNYDIRLLRLNYRDSVLKFLSL